MEKFKINANIVLDFMIENHYSEHSLSQYKRIYETMGEYLTENNLSYSPELGWELLDSGSDAPFGSKGKILHEAVIRKSMQFMLRVLFLTSWFHRGSLIQRCV